MCPPLPTPARPRAGARGIRGAAAVLGLMGMVWAADAAAQDTDARAFKLTAGVYRYGADTGRDLNLRWQQHDRHVWVGAYRDTAFATQWRAGVDDA